MRTMNVDETRALFEQFNAAYAKRYPNLRLVLEEYHEVSYLSTGGKVVRLGYYTPEQAKEKIATMDPARQAWVSEIRFHSAVHNGTHGQHVFLMKSGPKIRPFGNHGPRVYKRFRISIAKFLEHTPHNFETFWMGTTQSMPKTVVTKHVLAFSDGTTADVPHDQKKLEHALSQVTPARSLVKHDLVHELVDAPQR